MHVPEDNSHWGPVIAVEKGILVAGEGILAGESILAGEEGSPVAGEDSPVAGKDILAVEEGSPVAGEDIPDVEEDIPDVEHSAVEDVAGKEGESRADTEVEQEQVQLRRI